MTVLPVEVDVLALRRAGRRDGRLGAHSAAASSADAAGVLLRADDSAGARSADARPRPAARRLGGCRLSAGAAAAEVLSVVVVPAAARRGERQGHDAAGRHDGLSSARFPLFPSGRHPRRPPLQRLRRRRAGTRPTGRDYRPETLSVPDRNATFVRRVQELPADSRRSARSAARTLACGMVARHDSERRPGLSRGLRVGRRDVRVPDRGRRLGGRSRPVDLGRVLPPAGRHPRRFGRDVAADHYHRYRDDVALMRELGPGGVPLLDRLAARGARGLRRGQRAGLDFYDRLVDELLAAGIAPWATLYHWDLPLPLERTRRLARPRHRRALRGVRAARPRAPRRPRRVWLTHQRAVVRGVPRLRHGRARAGRAAIPAGSLAAAHHLLLAHGAGDRGAAGGRRGHDRRRRQPRAGAAGERRRARRRRRAAHRRAAEPAVPRHAAARHVPRRTWRPTSRRSATSRHVLPGDLAQIAAPLDVLGINYYYTWAVAGDGEPGERPTEWVGSPHVRFVEQPLPTTDMGWFIEPAGLRATLHRVRELRPACPSRSRSAGRPTRGRSTTPTASRTSTRTCARRTARSRRASTCAGSWSGRCSTTSSGAGATASASASSTSTTGRSAARPARARAGTGTWRARTRCPAVPSR